MADGLAQKYILKNSGRCMTLENGRFNVVKQVPASVRRSDTYNAVTSQQFREYLGEHNLHAEMRRLFQLASDGHTEAAVGLTQTIRQRAENILVSAPRTNDLVAQWLNNTIGLMQQSLDLISNALQSGEGLVEIQYIIEELSGAENGESEMFAEQLGQLRERPFPECDAMVCEEEEALA